MLNRGGFTDDQIIKLAKTRLLGGGYGSFRSLVSERDKALASIAVIGCRAALFYSRQVDCSFALTLEFSLSCLCVCVHLLENVFL